MSDTTSPDTAPGDNPDADTTAPSSHPSPGPASSSDAIAPMPGTRADVDDARDDLVNLLGKTNGSRAELADAASRFIDSTDTYLAALDDVVGEHNDPDEIQDVPPIVDNTPNTELDQPAEPAPAADPNVDDSTDDDTVRLADGTAVAL